MTRPENERVTGLILKKRGVIFMNYIVALSILSSCAFGRTNAPVCKPKALDADFMYVADLVNGVCVEYIVTNKQTMGVTLRAEYALVKGSPCDHMVGFRQRDYSRAKNSITGALGCR
jgi:hypothetical protein